MDTSFRLPLPSFETVKNGFYSAKTFASKNPTAIIALPVLAYFGKAIYDNNNFGATCSGIIAAGFCGWHYLNIRMSSTYELNNVQTDEYTCNITN